MKRVIGYTFLVAVTLLFSCEDNKYFTNCDDCESVEPVTAMLRADLDPYHSRGVIVMVWEGRIEDHVLFDSIRIYTSTYEKLVPLNRTYTITALYLIDNKSYTALDSATPRARYTEDLCNEPCYYVYDKSCNLKLKYTK
jgi:hypothetical protein